MAQSRWGIGWALTENMVHGADGAMVNPTLRNYRIPAFAYVLPSEVYFADTYDRIGPLGAKSTPATSQLDWLISTTEMIVLFWSKATRDLLKSFGWGIRALHQLVAATMVPSPCRLPHT